MPDLSPPPSATGAPESEHRYHDYIGNAIPWYIRAIWIGFWIFAVVYTIRYLLPAMQIELIQRP
ncbi:MAG: hypothetical protein ACR2IT_11415 [Pirellulales bacterium]